MAPLGEDLTQLRRSAEELVKAGRVAEAVECYRQILERIPDDWNSVKRLGDLLAKLGRSREAAETYARHARWRADDGGFYLRAIAEWIHISRLDPTWIEPLRQIPDLFLLLGDVPHALERYQALVAFCVERGLRDEAAAALEAMLRLDPADLETRARLADLRSRAGDPAASLEQHLAIAGELEAKGHDLEALQVLDRALRLDPTHRAVQMRMARIHRARREYAAAAHSLEAAARHAPADGLLLVDLGLAHFDAGAAEEAVAAFRRILALPQLDEETRCEAVRVVAETARRAEVAGQPELAWRLLELVLGLDPDPELAAWRARLGEAPEHADPADAQARRLARLVVSEIALYNRAQVEAGQRAHDLGTRLRRDLDRGRAFCLARVAGASTERRYDEEVVRTLCGGDPSALGPVRPAPPPEPPRDEIEVRDLMRAFRQRAEEVLGPDDCENHHCLGIAFLTLGLYPDAAREFERAAADSELLPAAASALARCFMELARPPEAIRWCRQGLTAPSLRTEELQALRRQLAEACEANGDLGAALNAWSEVAAEDRGDSVAASHVTRLRRALGKQGGRPRD